MRIVDVPAPVMPAPSCCRNSQSSTTCGSQAAWRISETPGRRGGGEQRRLGAGDRRFVQVDRRRLQTVRRLERVTGTVDDARAHRRRAPRDAWRCVRRAGKSPPGGASRARPRRASSGPSSSTEPRSRPTSAGSGSSFDHLRAPHAQRRACRCRRPRRRDRCSSRAITSTSLMRGMLVQHALFGGQQAGRQQRQRRVLVAFDRDPARQAVAAFNQQCRHHRTSPR